jgi:hypothetical protein
MMNVTGGNERDQRSQLVSQSYVRRTRYRVLQPVVINDRDQ